MSKKLVLSLVLTLCLTALSSAATWSVSSGDDIQAVIDGASDGDIIELANGTYAYDNARNLDFGGVNLQFRSASNDPSKCIINCGGVARAFYFHNGETEASVIQGITIVNGYATYGGAIECEGSSPTITNCVIENCSADYGGAIDIFYAAPVITDCVMAGNASRFDGAVIECAGESVLGDASEITNCLIYSNTAAGKGIIDIYDGAAMDITNSTIADNTGDNSYGGVYSADSTVTVLNSILWNNGTSLGGENYTVTYSCVENGYSGTKNIEKDPLFRTGPSGDYYLSQISAGQLVDSNCVNAGGKLVTAIFGTDYSSYTTSTHDDPEVITSMVDMGYHYYVSGTPVQYQLKTVVTPSGTGTIEPNLTAGQYYYQYAEVKLTATPAGTNRFMKWLEGSTIVEETNSVYVVTMDADKTVTAQFGSDATYKLTTYVKGGNGSILGVDPNDYPDEDDSSVYYIPQNTSATVTASPNSGYVLKQWYVGDTNVFDINDVATYELVAPSGNSLTEAIDANKTIVAEFKYQKYLLTTTTDGNGTVLPKRGYYAAGTIVKLTATPADGYRVNSWVVNSVNMGNWNTTTYNVTMDSNTTVKVLFETGSSRVIRVDSNGIQNAMDMAKSGDIVKIPAGIYIGTGFYVSGSKSISIVGDPENPENVVIDCTDEISGGFYIYSTSSCTLNGVTIANSSTRPNDGSDSDDPAVDGNSGGYNYGEGIYLANGNHKILNCVVCDITVIAGDGGDGADGNSVIVEGSYGGDGGWAMAGIMILSGSPYIANTIVQDCCAIGGNGGDGGNGYDSDTEPTGKGGQGGLPGPAYGGGITCWTGSSPTFENCTIKNCHAVGGIGGTGGDSGEGKSGAYGGLTSESDAWNKYRTDANGWTGAKSNEFVYEGWTIDISDYSAYGGGVYVGRLSTATFINCKFSGNTTEGCITGLGGNGGSGIQQLPRKNIHQASYGSGVFCDESSTATFTACDANDNEILVTDNRETVVSENDDFGGGCLGAYSATFIVKDCNIFENFSPTGGGIYTDWSSVKIIDSNIANNTSYSGGGIFTLDSNGLIIGSIIQNNAAGTMTVEDANLDEVLYGSGGGIYNMSSLVDINDCTITGNSTKVTGGGICIDGDWWLDATLKPIVMNCLITDNASIYEGGGIAATYYAEPTIQNCTIVDNRVTDVNGNGGGILASYAAEVIVKDTILWENTGIAGSQIAVTNGDEYSDMPSSVTIIYSDIDLSAKTEVDLSDSSSSSSTSTASTLVDSDTIYSEINTNGYANVIVTLADVDVTTDWSSAASINTLQNAVALRQTKVLSTLGSSAFTLRYQMENAAIFSGTVTASGLTTLLSNSLVAHIEPVRTVYPMLAQAIPLGNALKTRSSYNGADCSIAIIDTGIDYTHSKLGGASFPNTKVIGGYDFGDSDADPIPVSSAHGTCCAGIAAGSLGTVEDYIGGVAYGAKLYALKISSGSSDTLTTDAALSAWDWCITHKDDNSSYPIRVMSNSWGYTDYPIDNEEDADAFAPAFTEAAQKAVDAGITILAASGNDGFAGDGISWPSAMSNVVSVGAVYDTTGQVTDYSNTANNLDILAPADPVYTTDIVGSGGYSTGDYYDSFNGTSSACPFAAGCVAALQSAAAEILGETLTPAQIENVLKVTGTSVTDTKVAITKPMVNLGSAIALLNTSTPVYISDSGSSLVGVAQDSSGTWSVQGSSNLSEDPNFVLGYYLSNTGAGQDITSVCVDAGSVLASVLGLDAYTTRTDGIVDTATSYVDIGYHYASGLSVYDLTIDVNTVDANGTTNPTPGTYKNYEGEVVTIKAIPDVNSRVAKWIIDGNAVTTNKKTYSITMNGDHSVTVVFEVHTAQSLIVPEQYETIQEAIDASEDGDTIYVYPKADGTPHYISDVNGLDFGGRAITICSENPDDPNVVAEAIIDCNNRGRAFIFQNGEDSNSIIEGLTITNGLAAGEIATGTEKVVDSEDANIYVYNGIDADGDGFGGAIYVGEDTSPLIRKCVFTNCQATGGQGSDGGDGYDLSEDSELETGGDGGAGGSGSGNGYGGVIFCDVNSAPQILDCTFTDNTARGGVGGDGGDGGDGTSSKGGGDGGNGGSGSGNGYGGAVYCSENSAPTIAGCTFSDTLASLGLGGSGGSQGTGSESANDGSSGSASGTGFGGVIYYEAKATADINDCTFLNNIAAASSGNTLSGGGAFYFEPNCADLKITQSNIAGNQAVIGSGGAILLNANNSLVLDDCYLGGNVAAINGGAIVVGSKSDANLCSLTFNDCSFTGNTAGELGGGIFAKNCDANMMDCFINRNSADSGAGLYFVATSSFQAIGGTIADNNATGDESLGGGAVMLHVPAKFINCKITGNISAYAGGGLAFKGEESAASVVHNCLFAENIAEARGGSIFASLNSNITVTSCTFSKNETEIGGMGGGIFCTYTSSPTVRDCIFDENKRVAIYTNSTDSNPIISYCLFNANFSGDYYSLANSRLYDTYNADDQNTELDALNTNTGGNNKAGASSADTDDPASDDESIFTSGPLGDFYLKQVVADENDINVPAAAIDAGSDEANQISVFDSKTMADYTTRIDNVCDTNVLDIGFHYTDSNDVKRVYLTTVAGNNGSIEPESGYFYVGTTVELTAVPNTGWRVDEWSGTDDDSSTETSNYVVMMVDRTVSVSFEQPKNIYVPAEYTTLQEAINDSKSGDKIILSEGTYQYEDINYDYSGVWIVNKNITITSSAPDDPCVVANTIFLASRFVISGVDNTMVLDGVTIQDAIYGGKSPDCPDNAISADGVNGYSILGGAMYLSSASPTIRNVRFVNCGAFGGSGSDNCSSGGDGGWGGYAWGGAVGIESDSSPIFKNCQFISCYAEGGSGGDGDTSTTSPGHGGSWGDPNVDVSHTWDYADGAGEDGQSYAEYWYYSGYGGAVYCSSGSHPVFTNCTFNGNFVVGGTCGISAPYWNWPQNHYVIDSFGGAVYMAEGSQAEFTDCNFINNFADTRAQIGDGNAASLYEDSIDWVLSDPVVSYGGAICAEGTTSTPVVKNCIFSNNIACAGGSIYWEDSTAYISKSSFTSCSAMLGGAILLIDSNSVVYDCQFTSNSAVEDAGQGGAIYSASSSSMFYDCQFLKNEAAVSGGGLYFTGELEPNMHNCLVAKNSANRDGGGISANWDVQLNLSNCTVASNEVTGDDFSTSLGGGLSAAYEANVDIFNSIFWNNSADYGTEISIGTPFDAADKYKAEVTVAYSDVKGSDAGVFCDSNSSCKLNGYDTVPSTNLDGTSLTTPGFMSVDAWGSYFLMADDVNDPLQTYDSACIDAGSGTARENSMFRHTTRTDFGLDVGDSNVDMGYHYTLSSDIIGDFDLDGDVDLADFVAFLEYWMNDNCKYPYYCDGRDMTEDGEVDFEDYAIFAANYGNTETEAPTPNPMTWKVGPHSTSLTSISMTATTAKDNSGSKVYYYFLCISGGGSDRNWDTNSLYVNTGLTTGVQYGYRVQAKDARGNLTGWSKPRYAVAGEDATAPTPDPMTWSLEPYAISSTSVGMVATVATDSCGVEYYFDETSGNAGGNDSGWITSNTYIDDGLDANTTYTYKVQARDLSYNLNETDFSDEVDVTTLSESEDANSTDVNAPTPNPSEWEVTPYAYEDGIYFKHTMTAVEADDNSPPIEYYFDCTDGGGTDSGWITTNTYTTGGFYGAPNHSSYRVCTKDALGNVGGWSTTWNTYSGLVE